MMKIKQHPRNSRIEFDKEDHSYLFEGEKYFGGVTGWLGEYKEPFDAYTIAGYVASSRGITREEVLDEWKESRLYGDYVHENVELSVNNGIEMDIPEIILFKQVLDQYGLTPVISEWIVFDEDVEKASAVDLLCVNQEGKYVIIDVKTREKDVSYNGYRGKYMFEPIQDIPDSKYHQYCMQVNIYHRWLEQKYKLDLAEVHYVLRLRNDLAEMLPVLDLQDKVQLLYEDLKQQAA